MSATNRWRPPSTQISGIATLEVPESLHSLVWTASASDHPEANECDVYHHRLDNGLEADAIIRRRYTGEWIAVEVKLSQSPESIDAAAASLLRVAETVDSARTGPRIALLVITPVGYAYTRPDGVTIAPLTTLGPLYVSEHLVAALEAADAPRWRLGETRWGRWGDQAPGLKIIR